MRPVLTKQGKNQLLTYKAHCARFIIPGLLWLLHLRGPVYAQDILPASHPESWHLLSYSGIPSNRVNFIESGMQIIVQGSASPIIYPLQKPAVLKEISLDLAINGEINLQGKEQGTRGADDFLFRLGIVYEGKKP